MALRVSELGRTRRVARHPQHPFQLRTRPWQIQPFMISPVLPGETMKALLMQARVVSDPIKNPLVGWWTEYMFFYVKHRDLDDRDTFTSMMLDPSINTSALNSAAQVETYHAGNGIDWAQKCLEVVTKWYFRNGEEAWNDYMIGNLPVASVNASNWMDSVINSADYVSNDVVVADGDDANTSLDASEVDAAMRMWQMQREMNLTAQTYEEWLGTYGVKVKPEVINKPEIIRHVREWTYPSNTIDPATGAPNSAVSWSVAERADKDRYFKEPGFVFGVTVARPKIYFSGQKGAASILMNDAMSWLPAILSDMPETSLREVASGSGPIQGTTDDYIVDIRDLLLYGDQFVNFDVSATDASMAALPTATLGRWFAGSADADGLFVTPASANVVRQDGRVSLSILSQQRDATPGT